MRHIFIPDIPTPTKGDAATPIRPWATSNADARYVENGQTTGTQGLKGNGDTRDTDDCAFYEKSMPNEK